MMNTIKRPTTIIMPTTTPTPATRGIWSLFPTCRPVNVGLITDEVDAILEEDAVLDAVLDAILDGDKLGLLNDEVDFCALESLDEGGSVGGLIHTSVTLSAYQQLRSNS